MALKLLSGEKNAISSVLTEFQPIATLSSVNFRSAVALPENSSAIEDKKNENCCEKNGKTLKEKKKFVKYLRMWN